LDAKPRSELLSSLEFKWVHDADRHALEMEVSKFLKVKTDPCYSYGTFKFHVSFPERAGLAAGAMAQPYRFQSQEVNLPNQISSCNVCQQAAILLENLTLVQLDNHKIDDSYGSLVH
jgi:hypothetical protein